MENGIVMAGPPNNGNNVFEIIFISLINNVFRQDGCDIAFNPNGIPKRHCNIPNAEITAPLFAISVSNF